MKLHSSQSAAESLKGLINQYEKSSTTIPKGSRIIDLLSETPDISLELLFSRFYKERKPCIYLIITKDKPRVYIGSSVCFGYRMRKHRESLSKNKHWSKYMQSVYNKYGKKNLYVGVLEYCKDEELEAKEKEWIKKFWGNKELFNSTIDTHTIFRDPQFIKEYGGNNRRAILEFDLNGNFIKEYVSIKEAVIKHKSSTSNISGCCRGKFRHVKNRIFLYKEDYYGQKIELKPRLIGTQCENHRVKCMESTSRKVVKIENENMIIYPSVAEAERLNGLKPNTLGSRIKKNKTAKGLLFKYYEDIV